MRPDCLQSARERTAGNHRAHRGYRDVRQQALPFPAGTTRPIGEVRGFRGRHSGAVLILVLWVIMLLTIMAVSYATSMRREAVLAQNLRDGAVARQLAVAGARYAMLELSRPDGIRHWVPDGTPRAVDLGGETVMVSVRDEGGKVDLNNAREDLLDALFQTAGVEDEDRPALIDAILDWRDSDQDRRLHGAERGDYLAAGLSWGPTDGPFTNIEELAMVLGVEQALYRRVEPWITVHSGQGTLNPAAAPRPLLRTLSGLDDDTLDLWDDQRRAAAEQGLEQPTFPGQSPLLVAGRDGVTYSITSFVRTSEQAVTGVQTVVRRGGRASGKPYTTLTWKDGIPVEPIPR